MEKNDGGSQNLQFPVILKSKISESRDKLGQTPYAPTNKNSRAEERNFQEDI